MIRMKWDRMGHQGATRMGRWTGNTHEFGVEESLRKKKLSHKALDGQGIRAWRRWAGKSSRKLRRPRPYSRAFVGRSLRDMALPDIYAHAGINGKRREGGNRRDAPRRYVLRGTGESVLNRRIPKGGTLQEPRTGSIFIGGLPPLAGREFSIMQFHFSKTVATRRAASFL